jgi:predicted nucleotidyltransferase component of viral defense system
VQPGNCWLDGSASSKAAARSRVSFALRAATQNRSREKHAPIEAPSTRRAHTRRSPGYEGAQNRPQVAASPERIALPKFYRRTTRIPDRRLRHSNRSRAPVPICFSRRRSAAHRPAGNAPWAELKQVEQDLIISRALVDLFADPALARELRFRGGTALHKLYLPKPLRYSEDLDLVRTTAGPIGPVLDRIRHRLEPWLGHAAFEQSEAAPKLRFQVLAEDGSGTIKLKVEINIREVQAFGPPQTIPFEVENPWYAGGADIATFSGEELLATKLRALLQRDKRRDLFDLFHALSAFPDLDTARTLDCCAFYLDDGGTPISRAQAEQRMFAKLAATRFMTDIRLRRKKRRS